MSKVLNDFFDDLVRRHISQEYVHWLIFRPTNADFVMHIKKAREEQQKK